MERARPGGKLCRIRKCPADAACDAAGARAGSRNSYSSDRLSGLDAGNRAESPAEIFLSRVIRIPRPEFIKRKKRCGARVRTLLGETDLIGPQDVL